MQRSADESRTLRRLRDTLREGSETLDEALAYAEDRTRLAQRQARYLAFAAGFAPACLSAGDAVAPEDRLWWWHREQVSTGLKIRIIGLNTALLATNSDRGKLALGKAPLAQALTAPRPDPDELVIVLSHHPFRGGWLRDEKETDDWVRNHAHLHLFGHMHEAESEEARSGAGGAFVRVAAGAAHSDMSAPAAHSYNIAAVVDGPGGHRIEPLHVRRVVALRDASVRLGLQNDQLLLPGILRVERAQARGAPHAVPDELLHVRHRRAARLPVADSPHNMDLHADCSATRFALDSIARSRVGCCNEWIGKRSCWSRIL